MAGFAIPGLGSGGTIDFSSMLDQIKMAEQQKLVPYDKRKTVYTGQVSAWGKISSSLSALSDNISKMGEDGFHGVNVSTNKAFKATAKAGAQPDSYEIYVEQLARAHKIGTGSQSDKTNNLGDRSVDTRTLKITVGDGEPMEIELAKDQTSLEQIAKKINQEKGNVTASVRPTEEGGFTLVMTSKKTGEEGQIAVEVSGDDALAGVLDFDPNVQPRAGSNAMSTVTEAQNAIMVIDGTRLERSSNTINDAVEGVTLELQQVSEKDKDGEYAYENLSITSDTSKFKGAIEEFVKLYNAFISASDSASAWKAPADDAEGEANPGNGPLMGNGTLRRLTNDIRSITGSDNSQLSQVFSSLAKLGIEVKVEDAGTGKLTIDSSKLDDAVKNNPDEIEALFLGKGESEGVADRLQEMIKTYIGDKDSIPKTTGIIGQTTKGLEEQTKQVSARMSQVQKMIDATVERNRKDFERLDLAMNKMNNMSSQLSSMLARL
ncbi:flagellar filament capping protein FliD [Erwinia amylovora]|uniref:flagellar filament capping protein FliD n=1 Tax=Erwinia amylovora TaxID=552 RepID=UPI0021F3A463|nr:flagellar filament capping protein FliD [Erwinia amylovora]MCV6961281.1 flagellar filament capping protein FliD [Erwinia amylovora]MCZ2719052.1 flagellar filament capping protein FliD [Erwinia amylovora]MCZ2730687.1 flagellar filament capping protein FliD [Erwinia amylovora]UZB34075.1 flagellar filament capping protein FliD [Erwinia amylovora]UZB37402.1 flagellar filament capping protein FliD [Erwinia amylovora]